ncbi:alpha/beta family hydrolase [Marinimicrobium agarilyticum]|uniref:alpha/beta family hydrolase n=1 Tax=Marinimicrobium agarilyticum TaxID=306546 RepID=UPI000407A2CF|nr:alpha/beta family hydrolase [Marinimicrobium agarilyticum]
MIEWLKNTPAQPVARLLLAHGAGAPMDSDFMNAMAEGLCERNIDVWRFEFPYMAERRRTGKKRPPDRQPVLLECWQTAIDEAQGERPLLIGGKSMGGRMASLASQAPAVTGLVCLGYPFHSPGKPEKTRLEPLQNLTVPALVVQGTRDPLGRKEEVADYDLPPALDWLWLEDGDHDFKPRVKSGYRQIDHWQSSIDEVGRWIHTIVGEKE